MTLIPEHELQFLLEHVDEAKPWDTTEYKVEMFLRKYFCTLFMAFLAIAVLDTPFDYILIGITFALEMAISRCAYDMTMSGKDVVRLMYCTANPSRTNSEYKKYLSVFFVVFAIFFPLHMFVARQWEWVPQEIIQYPVLLTMPTLCFYSSLRMIRTRTAKGIFESADMYALLGNHMGGSSSPFVDGVTAFIPGASLRRVSHSLMVLFLFIFAGFCVFSLSMFWPIWPGHAPWWGLVVATAVPLQLVLIIVARLPIRSFTMKCFFIDQYRIHHFKGGNNDNSK